MWGHPWDKDTSKLSGKQNIMQKKKKKTHTRERRSGGGWPLLIWPTFVLWVRKLMMSAWHSWCPSTLTVSTQTTNSESPCGELTAYWPATKDVPPREMREFGLGSRLVTICSITLSTVSIRPLTTGVGCCSAITQQKNVHNQFTLAACSAQHYCMLTYWMVSHL